jgi:GT2 family glycosyltransferase
MTNDVIDMSIIIVNWNTKQLVLNCLASIYRTVNHATFEIIVVDNASSDGSPEAISETYPSITLIVNQANMGFAGAVNKALRLMRGKYAVMLNSDTVLKESALENMVAFMEHHPEAGLCGPQLLNADETKQVSAVNFPVLLTEFVSKIIVRYLFPKKYQAAFSTRSAIFKDPTPVDVIVGACMMARKTAIESVGMLDDEYFFLYEETDWCYRMNHAGWRVYHLPDVKIYHLCGQSRKNINLRSRAESWRSRYLFYKKNLHLSVLSWRGLLFLGIIQTAYHLLVYTFLNAITLFSFKRLRSRWHMFAYLLAWHLRGRPVSMGIPR